MSQEEGLWSTCFQWPLTSSLNSSCPSLHWCLYQIWKREIDLWPPNSNLFILELELTHTNNISLKVFLRVTIMTQTHCVGTHTLWQRKLTRQKCVHLPVSLVHTSLSLKKRTRKKGAKNTSDSLMFPSCVYCSPKQRENAVWLLNLKTIGAMKCIHLQMVCI